MRKNYNPTERKQQEGDGSRLYRSISDYVRRLDDARSCARNVGDLFAPNLQAQRSSLRDLCERLIFSDPLLFGRKGEDLLWRKGYYDVVSTAKRLKKQQYTSDEISNLQNHINSGIGQYHHLIAQLQCDFDIDLQGIIDFAINLEEKPIKKQITKILTNELQEWAKLSIHRCLVYLGDLSRYKLDIYPNWDPGLAIRYYLQAASFQPQYGMPHNQMGTLSSGTNHTLDAAYHYIRGLCCEHVFEGTENNLHRLFEKNSHYLEQLPIENPDVIIQPEPADHIKRFIARFMLLANVWFFNKELPHMYNLCHQTISDFHECLSYSKPLSSESGNDEESIESESSSLNTPNHLNSDIVFKIVVICILCIGKLNYLNSTHKSAVVAFTLAICSYLLDVIITHIEDSVLNLSLPSPEPVEKPTANGVVTNGKKTSSKKSSKKRRRRRANSGEESEASDAENNASDESSDNESIVSDAEEADLSSSDESDVEEPDAVNGGTVDVEESEKNGIKPTETSLQTVSDTVKKVHQMDPNDLLELVADEGFLQSVKVICDWLSGDLEVLKSCGKTGQTLLKKVIHLFNLISVDGCKKNLQGIKVNVKNLQSNEKKIALPEDVILKGVKILHAAQKGIEWNYLNGCFVLPKEEAFLRVSKLISFGKFLTGIRETGVVFNDTEKQFSVEEVPQATQTTVNTAVLANDQNVVAEGDERGTHQDVVPSSRGQLMKNMGQLWLTAEVRALEHRVRGRTALSPYLVLDADALTKYAHIAKQLVSARKFIVLVPTVVVSVLDDLKRESLEAREAIRWLESQFHRGNRFLRPQRSHERAPLPLIKYPKKKDKEAYTFIQIIECCYYLTQQQKGAANLVTLLTGNGNSLSTAETREISFVGLAKSAGVNVELIAEFHGKWKKSAKVVNR